MKEMLCVFCFIIASVANESDVEYNEDTTQTENNEVNESGLAREHDLGREESVQADEKGRIYGRGNQEGNSGNQGDSEGTSREMRQSDGEKHDNSASQRRIVRGVFHGSKFKFSHFAKSYVDLALHFGTEKHAKARLADGEGNIVKYDLVLNNPLETEDIFGERTPEQYFDALLKQSKLTNSEKNMLSNGFNDYLETDIKAEATISLTEKVTNGGLHIKVETEKDGVYISLEIYDDAGTANEIPLTEFIGKNELMDMLGFDETAKLLSGKNISSEAAEFLNAEVFSRAIAFEQNYLKLRKIEDILKSLGYDGFKYENQNEGAGTSFAVFDDSQIIRIDDADGVVSANSEIESTSDKETAGVERGFRAIASSYGEAGKAAYKAISGSRGVSASSFMEMHSAYTAGLSGIDIPQAKTLSQADINALYKAGQKDAKASLNAEKNAVGRRVVRKDAGLVQDAYTVNMDKETLTQVDRVLKALGLKGVFVDSVKGGQANAEIRSDGTILLAKDMESPIRTIIGHEITHRMQELAPKEYRAFRNAVMKELGESRDGRITSMLLRYKQAGVNINSEAAIDELAADYAGMLMEDGKLLDEFIEKHKENKSLLQRFLDAVRAVIAKLTGADKARLQTVESKLMKALETSAKVAGKAAKTDGKIKNTTVSGARWSMAGNKAKNADISKLAEAQRMESDGTDSETIRKATGWHKGYDGKWRFEIDDSKLLLFKNGDALFSQNHPEYVELQNLYNKLFTGNMSAEEQKKLSELDEMWGRERSRLAERVKKGNATLENIIQHDALFEAYPELRNVRIEFADMESGEKGSYSFSRNAITLSNSLSWEYTLKKTLLHEIEHAVQHIEGFAEGSNPTAWEFKKKSDLDESKKAHDDTLGKILSLDNGNYLDKWREYNRGEIELSELLAEESYTQEEKELFLKHIQNSQRYLALRDDSRSGELLYEKTAGEIEARDVSARSDLDAEQRKNTRPDIDRTDVVFADGAGENYSIGETDDGRPVVVVNDDITKYASNDKSLVNLVKQSIGKFPYVAISRQKIFFTNDTKRETTYSKYTKWLRKNDSKVYQDKMRLFSHPSEIVLATTDFVNEGLNHPRKDDIIDFARGKLLIDVLGKQYSAEVVIGFTEKGICELHDVLKLIPTKFKYKTRDALSTISHNDEHLQKRSSLATNSIPNPNGKVNKNISTANDIGIEADTEIDSVAPSGKFSLKNLRIAAGMTDADRTAILKEKSIKAPIYDGEADVVIAASKEDLSKSYGTFAKNAMRRIAEEFGMFEFTTEKYSIHDLNIEVAFSKGSLDESANKRVTDATQLAKLLPVLEETVQNAVGVEVHDNRYFSDINTKEFYELVGGYIEGDYFTPVRFGVKSFADGTYSLYVVVCQDKIEKTRVTRRPKSHEAMRDRPRLVDISIPQIFENVNAPDLLRYIPDDFLSNVQKETKYKAIAKTIEYTNDKNDKVYKDAIEKGDMKTAERIVKAAAKEAGYNTPKIYHGTSIGGFTVFDAYGGNFGLFGQGLYFTEDRSVAESYTKKGKGDCPQVYEAYGHTGKTLDMDTDADISEWKDAIPDAAEYFEGCKTNEDCFKALKEYCADEEMIKWEAEELITDVIQYNMGYNSITHIGGGRYNKNDTNRHRVHIFFDAAQIKSAETITYGDDGKVIPISQRFNAENPDIRYSLKGKDMYQAEYEAVMREAAEQGLSTEEVKKRIRGVNEKVLKALVKEYGVIPKGENPVRDVDVPRKISEDKVVSRFARTLIEAGITPEENISDFEKAILNGDMTHEVITNKQAQKWAKQQIEYHGFEEALKKWSVLSESGKVGKNELALGMELYNQCITNKDVHNAMKIASELASEATRAGQTLQACRILKLMSPDGQLYYLEKSVQKMNDEFREKLGDKFKDIELDENLMKDFLGEKDEVKRSSAYDAICQHIADQIPATMLDKWNSWRYLAMLGNPRTHIRNIIGNAIFVPSVRLKNYVGAIIEKSLGIKPEDRTKSFGKSKESVEFAKKDFEAMKKTLQGENAKYAITSDIDGKRTIFKTKWLEKLRLKNFDFLEKEDLVFLKLHYVDALARLITVRKIDVGSIDAHTLDALRAFAVKEAQAATYRDANVIAEGLNKLQRRIERSGNKAIRVSGILLEGVMPYKKTPMNIAKQGVNYSPLGLIKGTYKAFKSMKNGNVTVDEVIDDFAKGLTGTGMMLLGLWLASIGVLVGDDDKSEKEKNFDKMVGEQSYAFKVGDAFSYTIDWAAPSNLSLFIGAKLYGLTKDDFKLADIVDALSTVTEPLLELSVFSGVNGVIESAQYSDSEALIAIILDMATSYFTQALPTLGGQLSRMFDDNKREYYYVDKNSSMPKGFQRIIGQVSSKIPFASFLFEPAIDEWGREEKYGNVFERVLENTISPGYYAGNNYTKVDKELKTLYDRTGESSVLPVAQQKYYKEDGIYYYMSAKNYTEVKRIRGQKSFELVSALLNDELEVRLQDNKTKKYNTKVYSQMSDEEKVRALKKCYEEAGDYAKKQMLEKVKNKAKN